MPRFPIKAVFDDGIAFIACGSECHITVGPEFCVAADGKFRSFLVDHADHHSAGTDIAAFVRGFEVDGTVFFDGDTAACVPEGVVKAVFDENIFIA